MQYHAISNGYFETMGATLREGRFFSTYDTPDTEAVIIINETLARRYFPGQSAIGREIISSAFQIGPLGRNLMWAVSADGRPIPAATRIVGVVSDIQNVALGLPAERVSGGARRVWSVLVVGGAATTGTGNSSHPRLSGVLFGVAASDGAAIGSASALLLIAALLASLPAAWRAMRVDPVEGLRVE